MLIAYQPANGQSVAANGQIKVWVGDENPPFIAPGEKVDPNTGKITVPGDRTARDTPSPILPRTYLYEPALYIAPDTPENSGTAHFPTAIRGGVNNSPPNRLRTPALIAPMDPAPPGTVDHSEAGEDCLNMAADPKYCTAEFIWDVSSLNLPPGRYLAEFVVHDGDSDRGVGCIEIVITPPVP